MLAIKQFWLEGTWGAPVAPAPTLPRGMRPRRRLFKPLRVRREFVDVLELYSMYLEFQMLIGD